MEPQTSGTQSLSVKYIIVGIVLFILASAIGAIIGPNLFPRASRETVPASAPVIAVVAGSGPNNIVFGTTDEVHRLAGSVTAIKGNSFTLHTQAQGADASLADRTVTVTSDTKVIKLATRDPKALQSEMADFMKKQQSGKVQTELVLPPEPFTHTDAVASDIALGGIVMVTAVENIRTKKNFIANEIQIQTPMPMNIKK